jgi:mRNA interferase MazF
MVVTPAPYCPEKGDIVWLDFNPQTGHEQAGRRPALALSPSVYNSRSGLALFCPITGQIKQYPFEVELPEGLPVTGVVLSDHVKSLDWRARRSDYICTLPVSELNQVLAKLSALLR